MIDLFSRRVADINVIFTDIVTNDVSIAKHGFCPKLPDDITKFFRGDGAWGTPAGVTDHAALSHLAYADAAHTGFEPTVTKGNLTASTPVKVDNARQVIGGAAVLSLVNDVAAAVTEVDTGALANLDSVVPTSKAVTTALALKADIASPTFTGIPAAPTAALDTDTTQLATTQFVLNQASDDVAHMDGTAAAGTSERYTRHDHVHPTDTALVPKSLYDAQTILAATLDNTPAALIVAEQTLVGRITLGNVAALSAAQVKTLLAIAEGDVSGLVADLAAKIPKATNVTAINDTGIADGEIVVFNLTNKDIRTSDKTITTSLGADDTTVPTSKAVKDVTDGKEGTLTKGNLTASAPVALDNTRQVIGGAAVVSLVNDAAAAVTEIDTGALASSDTKIPTSKAVKDAIITDHGGLSGLTDDDHVRYFDKDGTKALTGTYFYRNVKNSYFLFNGGTGFADGSGACVLFTGSDYVIPGKFGLYVPNAAKTAVVEVMKVDGATDTPNLNLIGHEITAVLDPTTAQSAATRNYVDAIGQAWAAWTPTLTWTGGTPASITTVARWTRIGRVVFFSVDISSADSNAATALTISLPAAPVNNSIRCSFSGIERYGAAGATYSALPAYNDGTDSLIHFYAFNAGTDNQAIAVIVSGCYEVAEVV